MGIAVGVGATNAGVAVVAMVAGAVIAAVDMVDMVDTADTTDPIPRRNERHQARWRSVTERTLISRPPSGSDSS